MTTTAPVIPSLAILRYAMGGGPRARPTSAYAEDLGLRHDSCRGGAFLFAPVTQIAYCARVLAHSNRTATGRVGQRHSGQSGRTEPPRRRT